MVDLFPSIIPEADEDVEPLRPDEDRPGDGALTTISQAFDNGECAWCDDYNGGYPERHARKAHPERYTEWKETQ